MTLRARTVFEVFGKAQPVFLYWFTAQEQTSISRWKKSDFSYPKFSSEFNELSIKFQNHESVRKMAKTKTPQKIDIHGIQSLSVNHTINILKNNHLAGSIYIK